MGLTGNTLSELLFGLGSGLSVLFVENVEDADSNPLADNGFVVFTDNADTSS
jgi:hypothetical protein